LVIEHVFSELEDVMINVGFPTLFPGTLFSIEGGEKRDPGKEVARSQALKIISLTRLEENIFVSFGRRMLS